MAIEIKRGFEVFADRYKYDFGNMRLSNGWAQVDSRQDASYYGQWANPIERKLFSYCEGDTTLTECDTDEDFKKAFFEMIDWNKQAGYWIGLDAGGRVGAVAKRFIELGFGDLLH